jgi:hypothetical protein
MRTRKHRYAEVSTLEEALLASSAVHARWEWTAGFRHYIVEHDVQPSPEFQDFIYAV